MDRLESQLLYCPLLEDPQEYIADTVDLLRDHDARAYWLTCFKGALSIHVHPQDDNFSLRFTAEIYGESHRKPGTGRGCGPASREVWRQS